MSTLTDIAAQALDFARQEGADAADVILVAGQSLEAAVQNGAVERIERAEGQDLGLRVFVGSSQAIVSASRFGREDLAVLATRAVAMARSTPPDALAGIAGAELLCRNIPALDIADDVPAPSSEALLARARAAEEAALAVAGVTRSGGAGASTSAREVVLATSAGFMGTYRRTGHGVSASAIAGTGTGMERDYHYSSASHMADLKPAEEIGAEAGRRAVARINPVKIASGVMPVVYHPRVAASLARHLAGAISGPAIARGTSFLKDALGSRVFPAGITIIDDPLLARGLGSKPFDGEGLPVSRRALIDKGVLTGWLLDLRSARQLGLAPTGNASRSTGAPPGPSTSNLYIAPGTMSPAELMAGITRGVYVTELLGMGVNGITGDYSRGAAGFLIENGAMTTPVSEITIAGNLKDMFASLRVANDLTFSAGTNAPSCLVESMTIAGA